MIQVVALLLVFLSDLPSGINGAKQPEQIHLSVSHRKDEVIVVWITEKKPDEGSVVMYGLSKWWLNSTATSNSARRYRYDGIRMPGGYTSGYINKVVISGLKSDIYPITYYYKCGDPRNGWSEVKSFRTRPMHPDAPVVVAVVGDTDSGQPEESECRGRDNCVEGSKTVDVLDMMMRQHKNANPADLFVHVGDLSYADGNQPWWDEYGKIMEEYASVVPKVTAVGNHELENRDTFDAYLYRWGNAEYSNGGDFWYSLDYGPIHFVFLSTEHESNRQVAWLEQDLKAANRPDQRRRVPWIVAVAHRPLHSGRRVSMSEPNKRRFAQLFEKFKVSLFVCGHCHNYERTKPVNSDSGVTDSGDGSMKNPYITPIFPPTEEQLAENHYCNYNDCRGGRQGAVWCHKAKDNCHGCGGEWCSLDQGDDEGSSTSRWGTISMIVGVGGRRGDSCRAMDWTHGSPLMSRGAVFFTADRSSFETQYIDTKGKVLDEMKICSRQDCALATWIPPGRLPPRQTS